MVAISLPLKDSEKYASAHFVCTSQPFWKINHSLPVGFPLRFVPWFINQTPKERACGLRTAPRAVFQYNLLWGGKCRALWNTSASVLAISLLSVVFFCLVSQLLLHKTVLCSAISWASYKPCGLPIYSNFNWIPGSSNGALALPASHRWVPAGSVGSFFPTFSGTSKSHSQNTPSSTPHTWLTTTL